VTRLYLLVEGQSEEKFCKDVLGPHLNARGIWLIPIIVATKRDRQTGQKSKGGGRWTGWARDLRRLTMEHSGPGVRFTTLFDLYGLPDDFPGADAHSSVSDTVRRAGLLEQAMADSIGDWRLIPYLQRHEFEALVLACREHLRELLDPSDYPGFEALKVSLGQMEPEDVNDGAETAPSKRLEANISSYRKTLHGPLALEAAGLATVRAACPRFDAWVKKLEALVGAAQP
jgi:hypothetical protein